jgi:hypothetical protein
MHYLAELQYYLEDMHYEAKFYTSVIRIVYKYLVCGPMLCTALRGLPPLYIFLSIFIFND